MVHITGISHPVGTGLPMVEFQADAVADIDKLPTQSARGTTSGDAHSKVDDRCATGSTCVVATGSATSVYTLNPTTGWQKM